MVGPGNKRAGISLEHNGEGIGKHCYPKKLPKLILKGILHQIVVVLTSVLVKRVLGHRAQRSDPKPLLFRARRARNSKGFSVSRIHGSSSSSGRPALISTLTIAESKRLNPTRWFE